MNLSPETVEDALVLVRAYRDGIAACPDRANVDYVIHLANNGGECIAHLIDSIRSEGAVSFGERYAGTGMPIFHILQLVSDIEEVRLTEACQRVKAYISLPDLCEKNLAVWLLLVGGSDLDETELAKQILEKVIQS